MKGFEDRVGSPARGFDQDYICTEVCEKLCTDVSGDAPADVQDPEVAKGLIVQYVDLAQTK